MLLKYAKHTLFKLEDEPRRIVILQISTFQRPIFALYEPLRKAFCWLEMILTNQIRRLADNLVSLRKSTNDNTDYQNLCKTDTF